MIEERSHLIIGTHRIPSPPSCSSPMSPPIPPTSRLHPWCGQCSCRLMLSPFSSHRFTTSVSFQHFLYPDDAVAYVPPSQRDAFRTEICIGQEKTRIGVTAKRSRVADVHWIRWEKFCLTHGIDPFLTNCADPIPTIQVFAQRYRDGQEVPLHKAV
jgi:hypothetical protein